MHTDTTPSPTDTIRTWAPFMVVNPGETLIQAMTRHRRDTGHAGSVIVVAWNNGQRHSLAAA